MKKELTLSLDADLIETINQRAKLNGALDVSQMVEDFLFDQFMKDKQPGEDVLKLRGVVHLRDLQDKDHGERYQRIKEKHVR